MPKQLLFEINTRYWLYQLRKRYSEDLTLATIPDQEIESIATNFDWVWLMGIWDHSSLSKKFIEKHPGLIREVEEALEDWTEEDIIGSPYSVKTYTIHPKLGSKNDFNKLKKRFNGFGVKVMVDFVPNHYGIESPHAVENPDFFINLKEEPPQDQKHLFRKLETEEGTRWIALGKDPYFPPWDDTFQVNARNPETRQFLIEELKSIASMADGVRCDMAMLLNNEVVERSWGWLINDKWPQLEEEFWLKAIAIIKEEYSEFIFLAEVYWDMEWDLLQQGFDYAYDKRLYDRLVDENISEMHAHLTADITYQTRMCRFIENHDEERALHKMSKNQSLAASAMIMTLPGLTLIHHGQMTGNSIKIPVQLIRKTREIVFKSLQQEYAKIIDYVRNVIPAGAIWHMNDVIATSAMPSDSLFSWCWHTQDKVYTVVVNYANRGSDGLIPFNLSHPIFKNEHVDFVDHYNGKRYPWHTKNIQEDGLYIKLDAYGVHLFSVEASRSLSS